MTSLSGTVIYDPHCKLQCLFCSRHLMELLLSWLDPRAVSNLWKSNRTFRLNVFGVVGCTIQWRHAQLTIGTCPQLLQVVHSVHGVDLKDTDRVSLHDLPNASRVSFEGTNTLTTTSGSGPLPTHVRLLSLAPRGDNVNWSLLPPGLISLDTNTCGLSPILPGCLPPGLQQLYLGDSYNYPLTPGMFPNTLVLLQFGWGFKQNIPYDVFKFSSKLQTLIFGDLYNQPLDRGALPPAVTYLRFGKSFNQPIRYGVLPLFLVCVDFGHGKFNQPILPGVLPDTLTSLIVGDHFNKPLIRGCLPKSLTHLKLGCFFNQPFGESVLPANLRSIQFGLFFNQPLLEHVMPSSLTTIRLYSEKEYKHWIPPKLLPKVVYTHSREK